MDSNRPAARAWARLRALEQPEPLTKPIRLPAPADRDVYRTLNLAMRIGELMLSGGAGAGDVTSTMRAVTSSVGMVRCEPDVTYTIISISYLRGADSAPITASRKVARSGFDGTRLSIVLTVVDDLVEGRIGVPEAQERVEQLRRSPHPYPRWLATAAWGGLAASIGLLLGGGAVVMATAFVATILTDRLNRRLNRREVPFFYQYVVGGAVATFAAIALVAANVPVNSSLVVASGLIALLPGGLLVGSVQDAIGGFLVTATARALEVLVLIAGLLTGVALALDVGRRFDIVIEVDELASPLSRVPIRVLAAASAAGLFALANYAPRRVVLLSAGVGGLGFALLDGLTAVGLSRPTAAAGSAIAMGVACHVIADRARLAPLLLLVPAIIPQLPGLTTFRALLAITTGDQAAGLSLLLGALTIGLALAAGVIFGELIAQPVRREVNRIERHVGPRLIGPRRRRNSDTPSGTPSDSDTPS